MREELYLQWKSRNMINQALTKFVLRRRGYTDLAQLREERNQRYQLERRREEVNDAATQIQALVRKRQARQRYEELKECFQMMDDAARRIQRAYIHYRRAVAMSVLLERKQLQDELKDIGKLREFAAMRIQAMWRGRKERANQGEFLAFMQVHRHKYAGAIQRAWRRFKSLRSAHTIAEEATVSRQSTALHRQQCVAASRIASFFRMYRVRKMLQEQGHHLRPTKFILHNSARRIQCAWRRYASCSYVHQRRLATAFHDTEKVSQEALHAYATLIQALVRGRVLNPIRVALWKDLMHRPDAAGGSSGAGNPTRGWQEDRMDGDSENQCSDTVETAEEGGVPGQSSGQTVESSDMISEHAPQEPNIDPHECIDIPPLTVDNSNTNGPPYSHGDGTDASSGVGAQQLSPTEVCSHECDAAVKREALLDSDAELSSGCLRSDRANGGRVRFILPGEEELRIGAVLS